MLIFVKPLCFDRQILILFSFSIEILTSAKKFRTGVVLGFVITKQVTITVPVPKGTNQAIKTANRHAGVRKLIPYNKLHFLTMVFLSNLTNPFIFMFRNNHLTVRLEGSTLEVHFKRRWLDSDKLCSRITTPYLSLKTESFYLSYSA